MRLWLPPQRADTPGGHLLHRTVGETNNVQVAGARSRQQKLAPAAPIPAAVRFEKQNGLRIDLGLVHPAKFLVKGIAAFARPGIVGGFVNLGIAYILPDIIAPALGLGKL